MAEKNWNSVGLEQKERSDISTRCASQERASGMLDSAADRAKDAATGVSGAVGRAEEKVQEWVADATEFATQAKDRVQDWASSAYARSSEAATTFGRDLTNWMRRNPMPTMLIAIGLGVALARIIRRP
jgi:hypothetical protein